jgi:DNA-binding response OmpR family regulator
LTFPGPDEALAKSGPRYRVLVVEDEHKVATAIREGLIGEGFDVLVAETGEEAYFFITTSTLDIVLLDLMLPGRSGLEVLSVIRRQGIRTPVLLLTARDTLEDRVTGLDGGADDYLVKPFAFAELVARIRALLRRTRAAPDAVHLGVGDLKMDLVARKVTRGGVPVELTAREFELLECLLRYEGQVVSRETIARIVWPDTARSTTLDNVIDVHIARLRRKVDADDASKLIHTIRGVGFIVREAKP